MRLRDVVRKPWHCLTIVAGALWLFLAFTGALRQSAAFDELPHLADGLAILRYGDFRMNPEHPPLFKILAALPVEFFVAPPMPTNDPWWQRGIGTIYGYLVLYIEGPNAGMTLLLARMVPILTGLLGGFLVWCIADRVSGARSAFMSSSLLLFYPEYLGHARYLTLDVPTAVACAGVTLMLANWWYSPTPLRAAVFLVTAAVGSLVKLPVAVFAALSLLTALAICAAPRYRSRALSVVVLTAGLAVLGFASQWAAAGFRFSLYAPELPHTEANPYAFPAPENSGIRAITKFAFDHHLLPQTTIAVLNHTASFSGRQVTLLGMESREGWWYYFFVTILLKSPPVWLLAIPFLGVLAASFWKASPSGQHHRVLLLFVTVPALALLVLTMNSRVNIGHRHILFIYVPWAIWLGLLMDRWLGGNSLRRLLAAVVLGATVLTTFLTHPHQATYINRLGGGSPAAAIGTLADSNVDWGTDLPAAAEALLHAGVQRVNLAYFGLARPEAHGVRNYVWLLPNYPFAIGMPPAREPDPTLPTLVSLNTRAAVESLHPSLLATGEPLLINSMLLFPPGRNAPGDSGTRSAP